MPTKITQSHTASSIAQSAPLHLQQQASNQQMAIAKHVHFGDVQVRKHGMILGDNPATRKGLPVTIEWTHFESHTTRVDLYEYMTRRTREQTSRHALHHRKPNRLKREYRRIYLSSLGMYTNAEFLEVLMESARIQESRMQNAGEENLDKFNDFFETSAKALKGTSSMAVEATVHAMMKSTKVLGDSSTLVVKEAVTAARKGSLVAVGVAYTAGKVTSDAALTVGTAARRGSQMAMGAATTASTAALRGSAMAVGAAVTAGKVTTNAALSAGKASVDVARTATKATTTVAVSASKATTHAARHTTNAATAGAKTLVQAVVRAPLDLTNKVIAGGSHLIRGVNSSNSTGASASASSTESKTERASSLTICSSTESQDWNNEISYEYTAGFASQGVQRPQPQMLDHPIRPVLAEIAPESTSYSCQLASQLRLKV